MLILRAAIAIGAMMYTRARLLEMASRAHTEATSRPDVRAYIDGKPVKTRLEEK